MCSENNEHNEDSPSLAFLVGRPPFSSWYTSPTLISRFYRTRGSTHGTKFHAAEFVGGGEGETEAGREGRVLSERRASFACGIKIRVPRYTVVLRSQTRPSGSFHVRTREARLSASRNPFFLVSPLYPWTSRTCVWRGRGRAATLNPSK